MNNSPYSNETENLAQNYYPKALSFGKDEKPQSTAQHTETPSPFSSLFSTLFSGNSIGQNAPQLSQLLGGNPLLSALLGGNLNQSDIMSKLMSSFTPKSETKEDSEKVIDLSNSIEEL